MVMPAVRHMNIIESLSRQGSTFVGYISFGSDSPQDCFFLMSFCDNGLSSALPGLSQPISDRGILVILTIEIV